MSPFGRLLRMHALPRSRPFSIPCLAPRENAMTPRQGKVFRTSKQLEDLTVRQQHAAGIDVHAAGRPKSDVLDCQGIRRLHSYGLLTASFRPADEIVAWRGFQRQRDMLVRYAAQHVQHAQKALEAMNVKLTEVVSDIVGQTGLKIIQDIVRGERDPLKLARHRHERCKATEAEIASALFGNWRKEHLFALKQGLQM